ncbi:MAG: CapA family protein [Actinophytocola sp.]|uniref:CapA family protein n=1 Tax=Actinophytocola sp. TaxID=1872138 RepID=UPI00132661E3|nr:CapA family protein [Actinophytocola sp.]MPZ80159.1 CapA family protein [Actinophytocola sp.]
MSRVRRSLLVLCGITVLVTGCAGASGGTGAPQPVPPRPAGSSAPSSQTPVANSFTVVATGDVLIHPALTDQATEDGGGKRDFTKLFAGVRPVVEKADLAICHLEVPLADEDGPFEGYPLFAAPPEVATALAETGYDTCSTASNHTFDHGAEGVRTTLDALDDAGIGHTGSARTELEAAAPLVRDVAGVKVGQVSFTFGFNLGTEAPESWMGNVLDVEDVLAAARAARQAGAEVVIASLHWGIEDQHEPTAEQREIAAELLTDPAVDLIVGHHAHVVQPFDEIDGKWVAYGLGNQVARHEEPRGTTEEGVMARFRFTRGPDGWTVDKAEYLPTLVDLGPPIRLRDLTASSDVDPARRDEALDRTDGVVSSLGAADEGLTRPGE